MTQGGYQVIIILPIKTKWLLLHRKTQMSHLSHSGSLHGQKDSFFYIFLSHFVRVLTHYGSNESNDSFGFFCV